MAVLGLRQLNLLPMPVAGIKRAQLLGAGDFVKANESFTPRTRSGWMPVISLGSSPRTGMRAVRVVTVPLHGGECSTDPGHDIGRQRSLSQRAGIFLYLGDGAKAWNGKSAR